MVEVNKGIGRPQFAAQFLPGDYLAGLSKQTNKYSEGLFLQLDLDAIFSQFACAQVEFEVTKANGSRLAGDRHGHFSPDECSTAARSPRI